MVYPYDSNAHRSLRLLSSGLALLAVLCLSTGVGTSAEPAPSRFVSPSGFGGTETDVASVHPLDPTQRLAALERGLREPRLAPLPLDETVELPALAGVPVLNLNTAVGYSDLETAVAAASAGEHLRVQEDLMVGRFTIDKDLSIEGLTGTETLRATTATGTAGDDRAWILVDTGVELHVRDLVVDGNGFAIYQAFRHKGSGSFDGVVFTDIQYEPSGPLYQGMAIATNGGRVDVRNCAFDEIGRVGVLYFGTAVSGSIFENNTYTGKGAGDLLEYGLDIGSGAAVAVWNNVFIDCLGVASSDGSTSGAVLATDLADAGTVVLVRENAFLGNAIGVAIGFDNLDLTTSSLAFNRFAGNQAGVQNVAPAAVPAEHNWWACNAGPGQPGCDTIDVGAGAGAVDSDPWLVLSLIARSDPLGAGCGTSLVADLVMDSDGADTSGLGAVLDGTPVDFDGGLLGVATPATVGTVGGVASSLFQAGLLTGQSLASATVDNQTVTYWLTIEEALFCDGFESGNTSAWSGVVP